MKNVAYLTSNKPSTFNNSLARAAVDRIPTVNGKTVEIHRTQEGRTSAYILDIDGTKATKIKNEDLPKELNLITDPLQLAKYLKSVWARTTTLSNGDQKLYLHGKLKGGVLGKEELKQLNDNLKQYSDLSPEVKRDVIKLVLQEINAQRKEFSQKIEKAEGDLKNITLIVGATGSGKSTLFNYLNDIPLVIQEHNGNAILEVNHDALVETNSSAKIGHGKVSETVVPNFAKPKSIANARCYVDCAGEFDSKDILQSIINSYFKKDIANKAQEVSINIVVSYASIKADKGSAFRNVLNEVGKFISDWDIFKDSVSIVVTGVTQTMKEAESKILKEISDIAEKVPLGQGFNSILQKVIDKKNIGLFFEPTLKLTNPKAVEEGEDADWQIPQGEPYKLNKTKEVIGSSERLNKMLQNVSGITKKENVELFQNNIPGSTQKIIEAITSDLSNLITQQITKESVAIIQNRITGDLFEGKDINFKDYRTRIEGSNTTDDLFAKLDLKKSQDIIDHEQNLKEFSTLSNQVLNNFKYLQNSILSELDKIENELHALFEDTEVLNKGSVLQISGFAPKISQVLTVIDDNVKNIQIIGTHKVSIDVDLPKDKMSGKNLTIIANTWKIEGKRLIDLSGQDGAPHDVPIAQQGEDGKPGNPGKSGGNFFGYGNNFININNLAIISNGGNGGAGQDGGKGLNGTPGKDATADSEGFHVHTKVKDGPFAGHGKFGRKVKYVDNWFIYEYRNIELATDGGIGKIGGMGGKPGINGTIEILGVNCSDIQIVKNTGSPGKGGGGGLGGDCAKNGGYLERESYARYHNNIGMIYDVITKGSWTGEPYKSIKNTGYSKSGEKGLDGKNSYNIESPLVVPQIEYNKVINSAKDKLLQLSQKTSPYSTLPICLKQSLDNNEALRKKLQQ